MCFSKVTFTVLVLPFDLQMFHHVDLHVHETRSIVTLCHLTVDMSCATGVSPVTHDMLTDMAQCCNKAGYMHV